METIKITKKRIEEARIIVRFLETYPNVTTPEHLALIKYAFWYMSRCSSITPAQFRGFLKEGEWLLRERGDLARETAKFDELVWRSHEKEKLNKPDSLIESIK
jgi:hypothetical protein